MKGLLDGMTRRCTELEATKVNRPEMVAVADALRSIRSNLLKGGDAAAGGVRGEMVESLQAAQQHNQTQILSLQTHVRTLLRKAEQEREVAPPRIDSEAVEALRREVQEALLEIQEQVAYAPGHGEESGGDHGGKGWQGSRCGDQFVYRTRRECEHAGQLAAWLQLVGLAVLAARHASCSAGTAAQLSFPRHQQLVLSLKAPHPVPMRHDTALTPVPACPWEQLNEIFIKKADAEKVCRIPRGKRSPSHRH